MCVLVSVAFVTLLERKVLSYIQFRKGPNKLGVLGIIQPFSDALKLITKEYNFPLFSNQVLFFLSPLYSFVISLLLWLILPVYSFLIFINYRMLFFLCCLRLGVYGILISGWSSNSKYSLLGSLRSVAQTISYEIALALILLSLIVRFNSCNFSSYINGQIIFYSIFFLSPLFFILFCSLIAELNRTPFDFSEGESELVSGFNVEYSSYGFTLIFLSEYSNIIFISSLILHFFFSSSWGFFLSLKLVLVIFLIITIRGLLPRYRYDKLMYLSWKSILPLSLIIYPYFILLKIFL